MRGPLGAIMIASVFALAACSDKGLRVIRAPGPGPDEFAVLPVKPLTAPQDYAVLPAPTPGGTNLTDPTPVADAVEALGGRASALQPGAVPSSDAALVRTASRYGVPANTREVLAQEDADFRRRKGRLANIRLFKVDRYGEVYNNQAINPYATEEAFRRAGRETPSSPPEVR